MNSLTSHPHQILSSLGICKTCSKYLYVALILIMQQFSLSFLLPIKLPLFNFFPAGVRYFSGIIFQVKSFSRHFCCEWQIPAVLWLVFIDCITLTNKEFCVEYHDFLFDFFKIIFWYILWLDLTKSLVSKINIYAILT